MVQPEENPDIRITLTQGENGYEIKQVEIWKSADNDWKPGELGEKAETETAAPALATSFRCPLRPGCVGYWVLGECVYDCN